ncbi:ABC-type transport auxiliary lipoprotein family protein [Paucibacter soli]|uniref:ABC-type transport auxiliary lipoprotein family protein n=1 Tax=Paucibacter soli TaxID=3133433 RepID=UPI0030A5250A
MTSHPCATATLLALALACGACASLLPQAPALPASYSLDAGPTPAPAQAAASAPGLIVNTPRASAGLDSRHMLYQREPYRLAYYAHSEWLEPPAQLLAPLLLSALQGSAVLGPVAPSASATAAGLRLDTELLTLQQEFEGGGSLLRLALRARLIDNLTRRVLASRDFSTAEPASPANAQGGAAAANRALQRVLGELREFCIGTVHSADLGRP